MAGFQAKHLRPVPDPEPEHPVTRALDWIHNLNGATRLQTEALHHARRAQAAGNKEAELAFREAYEAAGRAKRAVRK